MTEALIWLGVLAYVALRLWRHYHRRHPR